MTECNLIITTIIISTWTILYKKSLSIMHFIMIITIVRIHTKVTCDRQVKPQIPTRYHFQYSRQHYNA